MTDYSNWKILKSEADAKSEEYSQVAEWCNNGGEYHIEEVGDEYQVVKNQEPTQEELNQQEIQQLKQYLQETDYVVIKIAEGEEPTAEALAIISERKKARARINELEAELKN